MCPADGLTAVDQRADFYSLGAILHHLITGKPLFHEYAPSDIMTAENTRDIAVAHRSKNPPPPTAGEHELLDGLVLQLLQKSPEQRYQSGESPFLVITNISAKGLIHDLRSIADGTAASDPNFSIGAVDRAATFNFPASTIRKSQWLNGI